MKRFGQAKLPLSYSHRASSANQDPQPKPPKKPISLSEFLSRKVGNTGAGLLQEKKISVGLLGSEKKDFDCKRNEAGNTSMLKGSIFEQFSEALKGKDNVGFGEYGAEAGMAGDCGIENEQGHSLKRKKPYGDAASNRKRLVVLGDDPKPRPKKRELKPIHNSAKTAYDHYANGHGWWDGDKEGIVSEGVGHSEIWEALGSTTLGGLEWH